MVLEIRDGGTGIDPDTVKKVFDPFFTTKEEGKGSGLGLATVYGIVTQGGGEVRLESSPGHGTTFRIFLPRSGAAPAPVEPSELAPRKAPDGSETILLVEDSEPLRQVALILLREAGYNVLEASCAREALKTLHATDARIDLLLTDLVMPGLNGIQLAEQVRTERPEIRLLYMSGYSEELGPGRGPLSTDGPLLKKPFKPSKLLEMVREVLDAADE